MKKTLRALTAAVTCLCLTPIVAACGGKGEDGYIDEEGNYIHKPGADAAQVEFWINGDDNEIAVFRNIVNKFNAAHKGAIEVNMTNRTGSEYADQLGISLANNSAADVFYVGDSGYKNYAELGYLYDITDLVNRSKIYDVSKMWSNVVTRYKYDVKTYESGTESGRYYGVPKDLGPTVIFYNETYFQNAGITILSVDEKGLDAFNKGGKDDRGNTKADLGLADVTVKEKGYFEVGSKKFFNNQIPMSWEETRTCAKLVQDYMRSIGKNKGYGYFTEWWFNYGWSVGGNCIQKIPSVAADGVSKGPYNCGYYYDFTLMDDTPNYIVKDDVKEGVTVNKKHYNAGQIIAYQDKLDMSVYYGKTAADGKNMYTNPDNYRITDEVNQLYANGKLNQLPSQKDAFAEFVRIGDIKDGSGNPVKVDGKDVYGISPLPTDIDGDAGKANEFEFGNFAMLVDGRWNVTNFRNSKSINFEWDVAPLPMYKEYDANGNVTVHGIEAGHSGSVGLCIANTSKLKNAAWAFIEYCASEEGQNLQAEAGFAIPLQKELASDPNGAFLDPTKKPRNSKVFLDATEYETAGDWWFLQDNAWIDDWANVLNGSVRNAKTTFDAFFTCAEYSSTFGKLEKYTANNR